MRPTHICGSTPSMSRGAIADVPLSDSSMKKDIGVCWGSSHPGAQDWCFSGSSEISVGLWTGLLCCLYHWMFKWRFFPRGISPPWGPLSQGLLGSLFPSYPPLFPASYYLSWQLCHVCRSSAWGSGAEQSLWFKTRNLKGNER